MQPSSQASETLRVTDAGRPFAKEFHDVFCTLMLSLELKTRNARFTRFDHTFTLDEALGNLGSLKFLQSTCAPCLRDPSRMVTTTTTTTFRMSKDVAHCLLQRFTQARLIQVISIWPGPFPTKSSLYQMTPKGISVLQQFCQRRGIKSQRVQEVVASARISMKLLILERDPETDRLVTDRATIEVIFRHFTGHSRPNIASSRKLLSNLQDGLIGVPMMLNEKFGKKMYPYTFLGQTAIDWLTNCCTTVDDYESYDICSSFLGNRLIEIAHDSHGSSTVAATKFSRSAVYALTAEGQVLCSWKGTNTSSSASDQRSPTQSSFDLQTNGTQDSNHLRLRYILNDPSLRLLFREFLTTSFCEENLSFYLELSAFIEYYAQQETAGAFARAESVRKTLSDAYGLYHTFLASGSPCELNIEYGLRRNLTIQMVSSMMDPNATKDDLVKIIDLFKAAQKSVFQLMCSDSVPKFFTDPNYAGILQQHDWDKLHAKEQ